MDSDPGLRRSHDNNSFTSIPILDLSLGSPSASPERRTHFLSHLRHALTDVGFLYVTNHSVPSTVISNLVGILPALFSLPSKTKSSDLALVNSPHFLGYSALGAETTAGNQDSREQFEFATELPANPSFTCAPADNEEAKDEFRVPLYERLKGPNQWPDEIKHPELASFRTIVETYTAELTSLGERFLKLVAEALDLPEETFFSFLSEQHRLKLVRYPPALVTRSIEEKSDNNKEEEFIQGVGPHKDSSGWWTFLLQASPPHVKGLQVLNKSGEWIDVPVIEGSFVVNIGQAFEVVTQGMCKATTHRVVLSTSQREERFSVPFFQGVRGDLTRSEAVDTLKVHFASWVKKDAEGSEEGAVDSPFLRGKYDTWGESQLRTKIRSHRDVGKRWYPDFYEQYVGDDNN
ncbi:hyoscyamine 6-dioxygenase [Rhypophila sp. PSN 637]